MIKFVCKDLFLYVYGKQIDNLRTNHRVSASHPALDHLLRPDCSWVTRTPHAPQPRHLARPLFSS
jgi:hypothetical protein